MPDASAVTIEQRTGPKRLMRFKGRSLPFRPLEFTRTQRVQTIWLPGNPKASQQVVGSTLDPTTLTGIWKDRFLARNDQDNGVDLINFPPLGPNALPESFVFGGGSFVGTTSYPGTQTARLARVVHDAVELLTVEGQSLRFQWDQFVRYGKITRYVARPGEPTGGISDIGWELELTWDGDVETPPIQRKTTLNLLSTASGLASALSDLTAAIDKAANLRQPNKFLAQVASTIGEITSVVADLVAVFRKAVAFVTLPDDLIATVQGSLQEVRQLVLGLFDQLETIRSAPGEAAQIGEPSAVQIAALVQQELRARLQELAAFAAEQQRVAALFSTDEILATFVANNFTSLRDVANQHYGDPTQWTAISDYNSFFSAVVQGGTLIRVPRLG